MLYLKIKNTLYTNSEFDSENVDKIKLISMIDKYRVIMITGPRQVGKITLLNYISRKLNKKINRVTLDDLILRNQAQEDPKLFLRTHDTPFIIDEIERVPELLSYIKMIFDNDNEKNIFGEKEKIETLYFLTDSQIFETYIVDEIIKSFVNYGKDAKKYLYYYRDNNQREIDLLIKYNNVIYPIEIKKSANPGKDAIKNFDVVNNFETKKGNGIVLCMTKNIIAYDNDNYIVPIEYI